MKTLGFQVFRCTQMGGLSDFQMPKPSLLSGHTYERSAIAKWLEALRNLDGIRSWEEGDVDRENEHQRNLYEQRCAMCSIYKFAMELSLWACGPPIYPCFRPSAVAHSVALSLFSRNDFCDLNMIFFLLQSTSMQFTSEGTTIKT